MRYSFCILKPDSVQRGLVDEIIRIIVGNGFSVICKKRFRFTSEIVELVYGHAKGKDHFGPMTQFLISGDSIAMVVESSCNDAIQRLNSLVGDTDPNKARPGTIRKLGESIRHNLIHSTSSKETFHKEVKLFFLPEELEKISCD